MQTACALENVNRPKSCPSLRINFVTSIFAGTSKMKTKPPVSLRCIQLWRAYCQGWGAVIGFQYLWYIFVYILLPYMREINVGYILKTGRADNCPASRQGPVVCTTIQSHTDTVLRFCGRTLILILILAWFTSTRDYTSPPWWWFLDAVIKTAQCPQSPEFCVVITPKSLRYGNLKPNWSSLHLDAKGRESLEKFAMVLLLVMLVTMCSITKYHSDSTTSGFQLLRLGLFSVILLTTNNGDFVWTLFWISRRNFSRHNLT